MWARFCLLVMAFAMAACSGGNGSSEEGGGNGSSEEGGGNGSSEEACQEYLAEYQRVAEELGGPMAPFTSDSDESAGLAVIGIGPTGRVIMMYKADVASAIRGMIEGNCVEAYAEATRAVREASTTPLVAPTQLGD